MDAERKAWLEKLAATCERVLASEEADRTDRQYAALLEDVADLLARLRADLADDRCRR